MNGIVKDILIASKQGEGLVSCDSVTVEEGNGIVGDRYYEGTGTFSEKLKGLPEVEVTLIEMEEVVAFNSKTSKNFEPKDFRRNIVTEGIRLNDLEGKMFKVGDVQLKGIRLCEPCAHLAGILGDEIMQYMVHKAGLRAQVIRGGEIQKLDVVSFVGDFE